MNPQLLYLGLKDLLANQPNWSTITNAISVPQREWIGKAHALLKRYDPIRAIEMNSKVPYLFMDSMAGRFSKSALSEILVIINQAVQDLEIDLPDTPQQIFGPGAVYDFYKELNDLFGGAKKSVMIIDPYMDAEIFDGYISRIDSGIEVKVFTNHNAPNLKIAFQKYLSQNQRNVVIKTSINLHDRIIIIDGINCWALGQSIKDAAKSKQTYMVPITDENSKLKIDHYMTLFDTSTIL